MNRTFKSLSGVGMLILGLIAGIGVTGYSFAQEGDSVLVQKIDALVDQLADLAKSNSTNFNKDVQSNFELQMSYSGSDVPGCVDNIDSLPNSTTFNSNVPWSTVDFNVAGSTSLGREEKMNQFIDLNGDGLNDYIYRMAFESGGRYEEACVLLNNGAGWDIAYRCVTLGGTYYGDCAQL